MSSLSNHAENAIINHFFRNYPVEPPGKLYLALYTSDPTDADTGTEVTGGGYARQVVTLSEPVNGVTSNATDVEFPIATVDWGHLTHAAVRDALTSGTLWLYGPLQTSKIIEKSDQFRIPAGKLTFTLD